jgi:hypothetical protein
MQVRQNNEPKHRPYAASADLCTASSLVAKAAILAEVSGVESKEVLNRDRLIACGFPPQLVEHARDQLVPACPQFPSRTMFQFEELGMTTDRQTTTSGLARKDSNHP